MTEEQTKFQDVEHSQRTKYSRAGHVAHLKDNNLTIRLIKWTTKMKWQMRYKNLLEM